MGNHSNHNRRRFLFGFDQKQDVEEDLEDLDEEQIIEILKEQGIMRKEKEEIKT